MQRLPGEGCDELLVASQGSSNLLSSVGIPQTDGAAFVAGCNLEIDFFVYLVVGESKIIKSSANRCKTLSSPS